MVEAEAYSTKTDWPLCSQKWCPFFNGCQVTGELSGTPALVRDRVRQKSLLSLSTVSGTQGSVMHSIEMTPTNTEEV